MTKAIVLYNDSIVQAETGKAVPELRSSETATEFLNDSPDRIGWPHVYRTADPFRAGDPLLLVAEIDVQARGKAGAESAYSALNVNHPEGWVHRSMSVGDVVLIDNDAFVCELVGFTQIDISDVLMSDIQEPST